MFLTILLLYLTAAIAVILLFLIIFGKSLIMFLHNPFTNREMKNRIYLPPFDDSPENELVQRSPLFWKIVGRLSGHLMTTYLAAPNSHLRWAQEARNQGKQAFIWFSGFLGYSIVLVEEPDVRFVLHNEHLFPKHIQYQNVESVAGKNSLITIRDPEKHTLVRRAVQPAFGKHIVQNEVGNYVLPKHVVALLSCLEKQNGEASSEFLFHNERMAVDVICDSAFRMDNHDDSEIASLFRSLGSVLNQQYMMIVGIPLSFQNFIRSIPFLSVYTKFDGLAVKIRKACRDCIETARNRPPAAHDKSLIDVLAKKESGLTVETSVDAIITFSFAGEHTTNKSLSWLLYYLAYHPEVQQQLFNEVEEVCALNAVPTYDDVAHLEFLWDVIRESLRVAPPFTQLPRSAVGEKVLPSGLRVPAKCEIGIPFIFMGRDSLKWGEDADVFRPSRWVDDKELISSFESAQYIPWSSGSRDCIGKDFSICELKVSVAAIVRRFELQKVPTEEFPEAHLALTLCMKKNVPLKFVKRKA